MDRVIEVIDVLERLKKEFNLKTDRKLCKLLGVKPNTLSNWKKRNRLDYEVILAICKRNNLDLNYIFYKTSEKSGSKNYTSFQYSYKENMA
ncbi:transcriptional regulator with XRE-family HTH domain [Mesonia hippocampi]|uniref:Transcriptional regulator with XRE-family HTH domain n=1 Tax=Mesonia hippocampi TaxID=1628250 RepID=A0A840EP41_9FLAO|nr:helix-turn-helix domain-containing protein [Mesonia hippocampi]MBB4118831.1 transcriptional regulator with XRE-family HTH domain [Mesonia hippocampi]